MSSLHLQGLRNASLVPKPQSSCCLNERPRDHCLHHCKLDRLSSCHPWHYALLKQRGGLINPLHVWHTPAVSEPSKTHNQPSFHPSIHPSIHQQQQPQTEPQPQPTTNNNKQLHMFEHIGVALSVWYHPCSPVMVFNQRFRFRDWKLTTWQPHITISPPDVQRSVIPSRHALRKRMRPATPCHLPHERRGERNIGPHLMI